MVSPGTYPDLSSLTAAVMGPEVQHRQPSILLLPMVLGSYNTKLGSGYDMSEYLTPAEESLLRSYTPTTVKNATVS